jgi:A/G-specific adenine glycosylase
MAARDRVIARRLVEWYRRGHRDLPWRATSDPYRIWISEIMLQQTRAQAVMPYYDRFLARFPSVTALAAAAEDEVLALWSGLGYYSRARNLLRAARQIDGAGGFPRDYDAIRALPGIGDYTAAAVASIAFGLPHAVLDGNVLRVVARMENDAADIASPRTRERFRDIAQGWLEKGWLEKDWLDPRDPGHFNQALMELGATVCLPKNPQCLLCPLTAECRARQAGTAGELPVKLRRTEPVAIEETLLVVRSRGRILLRQRGATARRMAGFWELPPAADFPEARLGKCYGTFRHTITHHHYVLTVVAASMCMPAGEFRWFDRDECLKVPLSTTARKGLQLAGYL